MLAILRGTPAVLLCAGLLVSCGSSKKPIIVGSKDETEQMILGEIVAQHVERRLGRTVVRRTGLGSTAVVYQAILSDSIGIYDQKFITDVVAFMLKANGFPAGQAELSTENDSLKTIVIRASRPVPPN